MSDNVRKTGSVIDEAFAQYGYPEEFLNQYVQMECLASRKGRETFLCKERDSGALVVAKCFSRDVYDYEPDGAVLRDYDFGGIPRYIRTFRNERWVCVVREYVEGRNLGAIMRDRTLMQDEITDICLKLCDILIRLHDLNPPVIHRDIKPENVICSEEGHVWLIDLDIARTVKPGVQWDTRYFGTRGYAPPEQYGFSQTDVRSDIYSFGVLLRFLLTGSIRPNPNVTVPAVMQTVIDKCTAFSPENRYASMREVKAALSVKPSKKRLSRAALAAIAAALILGLCSGFLVGRYTGFLRASVRFQEPLIEQAVRVMLGLDDDDPINSKSLKDVRKIFIYGTKVYLDDTLFYQQTVDGNERGDIATLDDLIQMPNLQEVHIALQDEVDISALAKLPDLYTVELKHLRVGDITPLGTLMVLKHALLFDSAVSDFTPLKSCRLLEDLDIGLNPIESLDQVGALIGVRSLSMKYLHMNSLDGLEAMTGVQTLELQDSEIGNYDALARMPSLKSVTVDANQYETVAGVLENTDVTVEQVGG